MSELPFLDMEPDEDEPDYERPQRNGFCRWCAFTVAATVAALVIGWAVTQAYGEEPSIIGVQRWSEGTNPKPGCLGTDASGALTPVDCTPFTPVLPPPKVTIKGIGDRTPDENELFVYRQGSMHSLGTLDLGK